MIFILEMFVKMDQHRILICQNVSDDFMNIGMDISTLL